MTVSNSAIISFPLATANWGVVTHMAIVDALTGGHTLYYGALSSSKNIEIDDRLTFLVGDIRLGLD